LSPITDKKGESTTAHLVGFADALHLLRRLRLLHPQVYAVVTQRMAWVPPNLGIRLEDVDWQTGELRVRRPKTKVSIQLPLLPAVALALTAYLRWERPAGPISSACVSPRKYALPTDNQRRHSEQTRTLPECVLPYRGHRHRFR
jgi:integrase